MGFSSRKSSSSSAASGIMFLSVRAEKSSPQKNFPRLQTASPALSVWKLFSRICFIAAALLWKQCVAALGLSESLRYVSGRSEEHTSELQSRLHLVCRLLLEKKNALHQRPQIL